tara:strand:+ start:164 stop:493 length:330 start_codon:yes stop_codon:yes gene_type:complete
MNSLSDEELFKMMKESPEFKNLPLPATWYKKFNLEPVKARNFKEFLDDDAWLKTRGMHVDEKEIRKDPVPGGVRPVFPLEEIPVSITSRKIDPTEVWGVEDKKEANQVQ